MTGFAPGALSWLDSASGCINAARSMVCANNADVINTNAAMISAQPSAVRLTFVFIKTVYLGGTVGGYRKRCDLPATRRREKRTPCGVRDSRNSIAIRVS